MPDSREIQTFDFRENDYAISASILQDKGMIIGGSTNSIRDNRDMLVMRIDENNQKVWVKSIGGKTTDRCFNVIELDDHSFIAVGSIQVSSGNLDMLVLRLSKTGEIIWSRNFGGRYNEDGRAVVQADDGSVIVVGTTASFGAGSNDVFLVKITKEGQLFWQRTFGNTSIDVGNDIKKLENGDFIIAGYSSNGIYPFHTLLIRVSSEGDELWKKIYTMGVSSDGRSVSILPDGGYIVSGNVRLSPYSGAISTMILRTDADGNVMWHNSFLGSTETNHGIILKDNIYAVAGQITTRQTNAFVMTVDAISGAQIDFKMYGTSGYSSANAILKKGSDFFVVGWIETDRIKKIDVFIEKINF
ncbi:MAG TPA: hypothetical protein PLG25_11710 [bacterium]|nr:hypothetical protein [bacterium]